MKRSNGGPAPLLARDFLRLIPEGALSRSVADAVEALGRMLKDLKEAPSPPLTVEGVCPHCQKHLRLEAKAPDQERVARAAALTSGVVSDLVRLVGWAAALGEAKDTSSRSVLEAEFVRVMTDSEIAEVERRLRVQQEAAQR